MTLQAIFVYVYDTLTSYFVYDASTYKLAFCFPLTQFVRFNAFSYTSTHELAIHIRRFNAFTCTYIYIYMHFRILVRRFNAFSYTCTTLRRTNSRGAFLLAARPWMFVFVKTQKFDSTVASSWVQVNSWMPTWIRHGRIVTLYGEVGGWGRVPFSKKLMNPTPRRKWYLTTGRRAH